MASEEKELSFGRLLEICRGLYKQAKHNIKQDEVSFQQVAINARYYHSLLMDEIQRMDATGVEVQLRGKGRVQILEKLQNYEQQDLDWDYLGTCYNTLVKDTIAYDSPAPRLFIILPADLDAWDDLDPATHTFRLYFLCNTKNEDSPRHHLPKHVHLSDHAGYSLKRPQEFMQAYGNYVLRILEAINRGYSDENIEIPYIGSFKILWKHTPRVGSKFSKDTFRPLVDKSIAYLQKTRRPDLFSDLALSRSECALIKTFLDVQVCDNTTGNLHRHIDHNQYVYWMCQAHAQQGAHSASLAGLESFVRNHRGHIDMQRSTLKVELRSVAEVGQFNSFLARTKHIFSISIKLRWEPTRLHLEHLCYGIVKTNAVSLEIDGLILDNHSQDHVQYLTSVFTNSIVPTSGLQLIVLLNFPRSQQWCIFTGDCALQSTLSTEQLLEFNWMELRSNLSKFRVLLSVAHEVSDCTTSSKELKSALAKHGIEYVNEIRIHDQYWAATCDLEAGIPVAMRLFHSDYDTSLGYMGVLQRLVVDLPDPEFGDELKRIIKANVELDELTVSVPGGDEVDQISGTDDHQPRDFVQLRFNGKNCNWVDPWKGRCVEGCPSRSEHQAQGFPTHISFQKWECDHAPLLRSDNSALVLDMAGRSYPLVLTSFVLDVSSLSSAGLVHVQNILRHSGLNHLTVMGMNFDPSLSESIAQTLQSVQWPTLKSFILFGDQINKWLALWSTHETQLTLTDPSMAPRLLCVHVQGSGSVQHQLSHASILFLHQLIDASPLAELYFQNVLLLDKRDWALVVESIDPLLLETLGLCPGSTRQLQDAGEAWEMFQAKFEMAE
ncbi:hypothetical protein BG005_008372 [Podila minutissima]|nr:hypothetical protein BG005_008372 [Podila minutissima]